VQLRLTVGGPGGARDVVVVLEPGATVADLAGALSGAGPSPGAAAPPVSLLARAAARRDGRSATATAPAVPVLRRRGVVLAPSVAVEDSGLVDGDVVRLGHDGDADGDGPPAGTGPTRWEVHVLAGPDAGDVHLLPDGVSVVGRGSSAEVTLADPTVDREHVLLALGSGRAEVEDLGGGARVDGEPVAGRAELGAGARLRVGRSEFRLEPASAPDAAVSGDRAGGLAYNRPPRIRPAARARRITLPNEPTEQEGPRFQVVTVIAPIVFGVTLALALSQPRFLLFTLLSPIMIIGNYVGDRRHNRKRGRRVAGEYAAELAAAEAEIEAAVTTERDALLAAAPGPSEVLLQAAGPRRRLWERRVDDDDLLALRVGLADQPSRVQVVDRSAPDGAPPRVMPAVPVVLPLADLGVVGVAGPRGPLMASARWLVGQVAVLHSPRDVKVCVLTADDGAQDDWDWLRWLPHARLSDDPAAPLLVGADRTGVAARLTELVALVTARTRAAADARAGERQVVGERVLVVLDGARSLRGLTGMPQVLQDGPAVGVHAVCLDLQERLLPEECRAVVALDPDGSATVGTTGGEVHRDARPDGVTPAWALRVARALAPLRDTSRDDESAGLPTGLRLLAELGLDPPDADGVRRGWAEGGRSTRALLGRSVEGPFAVDLRTDGPHALVAGTTGAGKSELLQTMIASLAVANRPDALTFVLVDYKGGAAFKDCARLPHTVGMVTDLDGHLTERALASLTAELKRRETVLAASGSKDVEDHGDALDAGLDAEALPRLVIVIDEFASLVEELPDFVRGLVGIAQRGRSLGVHLVLATQRPGGVVSPEIRANTNLRVALRVTDPSESSDVIDAPDAARVSRATPGRGYVRTGHASLTAFQAARVGGRRPGATTSVGPQVLEVPLARLGHALPVRAPQAVADDERTDLADLVDAVVAAADRTALAPVTRPWLPALPDALTLEALGHHPDLVLPFGLQDRPADQAQAPAVLDLECGGHLLVCGSPRSGRSTLLRTLAGAAARGTSSADVHVYGIDCGNGALLPLVALPHVGAVVTREQTDRLGRLLERLSEEVTRRQERLAGAGYADLREQRAAAAPGKRLPYLVLLLDRWEGYVQEFQDLDGGRLLDALLRLLREGPGVGLRIVITADRSGLVGRLSGAVEDRAVLRLADRNDYGLLGMAVRAVPDHVPPGRMFRGDDLVETQVALLDADAAGPAQVEALQSLARQAQERDRGLPRQARPFRVDALPRRLSVAEAERLDGDRTPGTPTTVLVGVGGDELGRVEVDVALEGPGLVVGGPPRSGRSTALLAMSESALRRGAALVVVLPRRSPLRDLEGRPGVLGVLDATASAGELDALVAASDGPVVVVADDAELLGESPLAEPLTRFLRSARDGGGAVLVGGTTEELTNVYRGFVTDVRKSRCGLLLTPGSALDGDLLSVRLPRSTGGAYPPGRGLFVLRGEIVPVQVPLPA